ncbi:MAG: PilZ domain-containing protein [Proteobacteria bacterium]|nr:PilZ domain-containing protein [Pseudomonadota bacterium]
MIPADAPGRQDRAPRKNLFMAAEIEADGVTLPVRIRNLSQGGAMIEGAVLPGEGAALILRRLQIELPATVVWRAAGRCGIRFGEPAFVEEWVAGRRSPERMFGRGQARVDTIQAAIRSGGIIADDCPSTAGAAPDGRDLDRRLSEELAYVRRLLDVVGDELSDDPIMLQRHAHTLQNFDLACQILGHVGAILGAANRPNAVAAVTLEELRMRLLRKPAL